MIFDGELPLWSEEDHLWIIRESPEWILAVQPMLFNDRVILARPRTLRRHFTAGFCYDKSAGCSKAMVAAILWDLDARRYPEGMKKIAYDNRVNPESFQADPIQAVCWLCLGDRTAPPFMQARHCAVCGASTTEGRLLPFNHATMLYATGGYRQEEACPA